MATDAPRAGFDPFNGEHTGNRAALHAALRHAGPVVRAEAQAGGPVWIVTEYALARRVLSDPRFSKDPALAPSHWHGREATLEPPASEQRSLTTIDGEEHLKLRRTHAPAFTSRTLVPKSDRIAAIARELMDDLARTSRQAKEPADLMATFTYHFPLTVLCDLLGVPITDFGKAREASEAMAHGTKEEGWAGMVALDELVAAAVSKARERGDDTMTSILYERANAELGDVTDDEMRYMITGLIFAGHETTGAFLGSLLSHLLAGHLDAEADEATINAFVEEVLRLHPPVSYTLWRFTTSEVGIAGVTLPKGAPVLVDIEGINTDERWCGADPDELRTSRASSRHLTFGSGPHHCVGARLARLESRIALQVLRADFPHARLAVPFDGLQWSWDLQAQTGRLAALPVWLDGPPDADAGSIV